MAVDYTDPYSYDYDRAQRQLALAQALREQGMAPIPEPNYPGARISPYQGLAKILATISGNIQQNRAEKKLAEVAQKREADRSADWTELMRLLGGTTPAPVSQPSMGAAAPISGNLPQSDSSVTLGGSGAPELQMQNITPQAIAQSMGQVPNALYNGSGTDTAQFQHQPMTAQDLAQANMRTPQMQEYVMGMMARQPGIDAERKQRDWQQNMEAQRFQEQQARNAEDSRYRFNQEARNAELFPAQLKQAQNQAVTSAPNAAGLTPSEQAQMDARNAPKPVTYTAQRVMVDGEPKMVFSTSDGQYVDPVTHKPIQGIVTPFVPPGQKAGLTPNAQADLMQRLNRDWERAASDVESLYRANHIIDAGIQAAEGGSMNAGAQAVLVTFQKFLDPTSVVRESEYARSGEGLAMADRIRGYVDKLQQGGAGVPLDELKKFAQLGKEINSRLANESNSLLAAKKRRIESVAKRYDIPQEYVITQYNYAGTPSATPAVPTPATQPTVEDLRKKYNY